MSDDHEKEAPEESDWDEDAIETVGGDILIESATDMDEVDLGDLPETLGVKR